MATMATMATGADCVDSTGYAMFVAVGLALGLVAVASSLAKRSPHCRYRPVLCRALPQAVGIALSRRHLTVQRTFRLAGRPR